MVKRRAGGWRGPYFTSLFAQLGQTMSAPSETILVTGASGLLGSHVVDQLLREGYPVRAVARSAKVAAVQATYQEHSNKLEVVAVENIVDGDFTAALRGVRALVHVASPLAGRGDAKTVLESAIQGTRNVLEQAIRAGVKRIVLTSSEAALYNPFQGKQKTSGLLTESDWNVTTEDEALASGHPGVVYSVSKATAERTAWEIVEKHSDVNLTTIVLPCLFGSFVKGWPLKPADSIAMSTNGLVYDFLNGNPAPFGVTRMLQINIHTAALAHVRALQAPPSAQVGRKRLLLAGDSCAWVQLAELLRKVRPALADRLPKYDNVEEEPPAILFDNERTKKLLGIAKVAGWQETMVEAVDDLLRLEGEWEKAGWQRNVAK